MHLAVSFSLIILLTLSAGFSFILSVVHATDLIFPGNSVLSLIFSPKIQQGANASQISYLELLTTLSKTGNFSDSIETGTYENIMLGTLTMSHSSGKESKACIHRIGEEPQEYK